VNNAIAGANLAAGHPDAAVTYLQTALRSRPDYFDAHYNLGTALAMHNNFAAALEEFRTAVCLNPQDANAEANLGAALAESGNWKEARISPMTNDGCPALGLFSAAIRFVDRGVVLAVRPSAPTPLRKSNAPDSWRCRCGPAHR
jgi:tetratricopeptide (TPR) repeat protein